MQIARSTTAIFSITILTIATFLIPMIFADPTDEETFREKCYKCHDKEGEYKEWEKSGHAKSLTNLRKSSDADDSCLTCHSSGYSRDAGQWGARSTPLPTLKTAQNEVGCSSCHRHGNKKEHYLLQPAEKLCASCHKMDCG